MTINELKNKAKWVRQTVMEMSVAANSGHITTAFSQCELTVALYYTILNVDPNNPHDDNRDRFILSKGQGGIGLYPILADLGFFSKDELIKFTKPKSLLGVHAESRIPGIELLTGSLGHGLPIASGMALDAKVKNKKHKIVCLLGDGELFEGSNWETLFFVSHYQLDNLVLIVDRNKQSTLGFHDGESEFCDPTYHKDGPCLNPLDKKFESFGFNVRTIKDGHDFQQISEAFSDFREYSGRPLVIISKTSKGRGTSITQNQRLWHYRYPQGSDLETMRKDLEMGLDEFDKQYNNKVSVKQTPIHGAY
jgi:transketolase